MASAESSQWTPTADKLTASSRGHQRYGRLSSVAHARKGVTTNYAYGATNQVASFAYANGVGHVNTYDNRDRLTNLAVNAAQTNAFDANDRLTSDTYDANGNTLSSGWNTFGYELDDRLTSYNGGAIGYVYDGDGNRVVRTAGGSTTRLLIDDLTPTGYAQVAEEVVAGAAQ